MPYWTDMIVRVVAVGALALLWALASWDWPKFLFLQSDTFWLLESGRYILEHHCLPAHDIYSFTRQGGVWIVYQWLFEVALAGLFAVGGWLFVSLLAMLMLAWLFFVDIPRSTLAAKANGLVVVLVILSAVVSALPDVVAVRPQLVTFVLLWLTQKLLNGNWPSANRTLWLSVPIMVVWANVHISFVIQLAVLAIYALAAVTSQLRLRLLESDTDGSETGVATSRRGASDLWIFSVVLVACVLASLANPYGPEIYQFIGQSWKDHNITPELRPVDWTQDWLLLAYVVLACVSMALSARNFAVPRLAVALIFLAAGLAGARFMLYFVIWSLPLTCEALTSLARAFLDREGLVRAFSERLRLAVMEPGYPLVVLLAIGCVTAARPTFFPGIIPVAAAEELAKHHPQGSLFCGEHAGSYLIFRFRGEIPVFIDTRADVYGREFCDLFREVMLTGRRWSEVAQRFHIESALVPLRYQLAKDLQKSEQWRATYKDENYAIFQQVSH